MRLKGAKCVKEAPQKEDGTLFWYQGDTWRQDVEILPFEPFEATLFVSGFSRGRSSAKVLLDGEGRRYEMFLVTFMDIVQTLGYAPEAGISGTWGICKKGQNYGVFLMEGAG